MNKIRIIERMPVSRLYIRSSVRPSTAGHIGRNSNIDEKVSLRRKYHSYCTDPKLYDEYRANTPRVQDLEREKYSFKATIRPISAPHHKISRRERLTTWSAKRENITKCKMKIHASSKE